MDYNQVAKILHPIGMTCSCFILLFIVLIRCYDKSLLNRVSMRLVAAISLADIILHTLDYLVISTFTPGHYCNFISLYLIFGTQFYCFTNLTVSYILYQGFVSQKRFSRRDELKLWAFVFVASLFTPLLMLATGDVGINKDLGLCVGGVHLAAHIFLRVSKMIILLVTILYGIFVAVKVKLALAEYVERYINIKSREKLDKEFLRTSLTSHLQRALLYPLAPVITQTGSLAFVIMDLAGGKIKWIRAWFTIGFAISGIVTFLSFVIDLSFQKAVTQIYYDLSGRFGKERPSDSDSRVGLNDYNMSQTNSTSHNFNTSTNGSQFTPEGISSAIQIANSATIVKINNETIYVPEADSLRNLLAVINEV